MKNLCSRRRPRYGIPLEALRRAARGERVVFRPPLGPALALVSLEDAELLARLEDERDNRLADEALAEDGENVTLDVILADYEAKYGVLD
ncbi:hypothetical protein Apau_1060 [Aminomonas paucivorans DSM 12260]|uniref:Prevent-host-death family protein n=1 Tax=Aminomonas paucivorans DSM 12260 TaxID=584708 RepID=E3CXC1_9BACT|nr:hypothetical protein Apau_1060 [Aminomonas paucivorans DSM 12260]